MKRITARRQLVNTRFLADRWGQSLRTALRVCRYHQLTEIRLRQGGHVLFRMADIVKLEGDWEVEGDN